MRRRRRNPIIRVHKDFQKRMHELNEEFGKPGTVDITRRIAKQLKSKKESRKLEWAEFKFRI